MFGDSGSDAVYKEMKQLHDQGVCEPRHAKDLTCQQHHDALGYFMFLKEKTNGIIKGHGCANGQKQCIRTRKEDASSPTVVTKSVLLTSVIEAKEHQHVISTDIPGAFMQGDQEERVHLQLKGILAEMFIKCNPA